MHNWHRALTELGRCELRTRLNDEAKSKVLMVALNLVDEVEAIEAKYKMGG